MDLDEFRKQVDELREHTAGLRRRGYGEVGRLNDVADDAIEQLGTSLEELQVAEEELHLQNEELIEGRQTIETERLRYEELFNLAPDIYLATDSRGVIEEANRAATELLCVERAYLIGKPLLVFIVADSGQAYLSTLHRLREGERVRGWETWLRPGDHDRESFPCTADVDPILDSQGDVVGLRWLMHDTTARKRAENKLLAYQEELRSLASELLLGEERERRRLAAELHDGLGQELSLLKMKLRSLSQSPEVSVSRFLQEFTPVVDKAHEAVRSLTFQISPPVLHDLGLEAALEWLAEDMLERYGVEVAFENDGQHKPVDERVRTFLFRAVRELLINVSKHAGVDRACMKVNQDGRFLRVTVADEGVGFDRASAEGRGFGLFSIRERLSHIGGRVEIESEPGKGTKVGLVAPLADEQQSGAEDSHEHQDPPRR